MANAQKSIFDAACLLYDPTSGRVIHGFHTEIMAGARRQSFTEQEIEKFARDAAKAVGRQNVEKLMALHVKAGDVEPGNGYVVDPKTKKIQKLERPKNLERPQR